MDRFSEEAPVWDDKPGHRERAATVAAAIRECIELRPDMRVLEIGAGTGLLARALKEDIGTAVVTDVAPGMVTQAQRLLVDEGLTGWEARRYDIEHDPLMTERFDLVLGLLTLHHMGQVEVVISRCAELLQRDGYVALVDLDHDPEGAFHAGVHDFDGHDGFTRENIHDWLHTAGLVDITLSTADVVTKEVEGERRDFPLFLATGRR